jgi:hypothetical protein
MFTIGNISKRNLNQKLSLNWRIFWMLYTELITTLECEMQDRMFGCPTRCLLRNPLRATRQPYTFLWYLIWYDSINFKDGLRPFFALCSVISNHLQDYCCWNLKPHSRTILATIISDNVRETFVENLTAAYVLNDSLHLLNLKFPYPVVKNILFFLYAIHIFEVLNDDFSNVVC